MRIVTVSYTHLDVYKRQDFICAGLILELRKKYRQISLECAVPYEEQAVRWAVELRETYYDILAGCDKPVSYTHLLVQMLPFSLRSCWVSS